MPFVGSAFGSFGGTSTPEHVVTSGALAAQAALLSANAQRYALHTGAGALSAQYATVSGTAIHPHVASGALAAGAASVSGAAVSGDPYFDYVVLLLPLNGSNGETSFTDFSKYNHSIINTASVPVTAQDAQSMWGGSSGYFDGAGTPFLRALEQLSPGDEFVYAGDFAIEYWIYFTETDGNQQYAINHSSTANNSAVIMYPGTGVTQLYNTASFIINGGATAYSANTWYFMQIIRSGSTITIARDGVSYLTATESVQLGGNEVVIGNYQPNSSYPIRGYLQDFRITNGIARPIAVPSAPFPTHGPT